MTDVIPSWRDRTPAERERLALVALAAVPRMDARDFVAAEAVVGEARRLLGLDPLSGREGPSAVGLGRVLSRAADAGKCEKRLDGYMYRYRSIADG